MDAVRRRVLRWLASSVLLPLLTRSPLMGATAAFSSTHR
jgi:hypothetical protein